MAPNAAHTWAAVTMRANGFGRTASAPVGYAAPQRGGVCPAVTAGAMATYRHTTITVAGSAVGELGRDGTATCTITIDAASIGELIASGAALSNITINGVGDLVGTLSGDASGTVTIGAVANVDALALPNATAAIVITGTAQPIGLGHMTATTEDLGELTPESIAAAVLAATAESGPDGSFSTAEMLRIIAAAVAGLLSGGPGSPNIKALTDATKTRINGTADSSGNRTAATYDAT